MHMPALARPIGFLCLGIMCLYFAARNGWFPNVGNFAASGSEHQVRLDEDSKSDENGKLFTKEELWKYYRGEENSKGLYVAIMGRVYDVAKGEKFYGTGGSYHFFAGRDGTKAYSTGEFDEGGLTDIVAGVELDSYHDFAHWVQFFDDNYDYVGKLIGNFYDENGDPTKALIEAQKLTEKAKREKEAEEEYNARFPACEYDQTMQGTHIRCTKDSGGVSRDWVGVPRLWQPEGSATAICVCVRNYGPPRLGHTDVDDDRGDLDYPYFKEYIDCDPKSPSCEEKFPWADHTTEL